MKKNLIVLFVIILSLALVLTSCMVDKDPEINVTDQSVLEGDTLTVDLSTKVTDPEGKPITITKVSGVGTLTGKVYTYTPSFSDAGVKEVTLKASDGKREVQKTFKITVRNAVAGSVVVRVAEYTTGPGLEDADVKIDKDGTIIGSGKTDADGNVTIVFKYEGSSDASFPVKISAKKTGYTAPSVISGKVLNVSNSGTPNNNGIIDIMARKAGTSAETSTLPDLEIKLYDLNKNIVDPTNISTNTILVYVKNKSMLDGKPEPIEVGYVGLGYVPTATARNTAFTGTSEATMTVSLVGYDKKTTDLNIVAYNINDARIQYTIPLTVNYGSAPITSEKYAPKVIGAIGFTSDVDLRYYSAGLISKLSKDLPFDDLNEVFLDARNSDENIFMQIQWTTPATKTGIVGYNLYRSEDKVNWEFIKTRAGSTGASLNESCFGVVPGKKYYYNVKSLYSDGTESLASNTLEVIPLKSFDVRLNSPANNAIDVSLTPQFSWTPVDSQDHSKTVNLSNGLTNDASILFHYTPWVYDTTQDESGIFVVNSLGNQFDFVTAGAQEVTVDFLCSSWGGAPTRWILNSVIYPYKGLEQGKTYEWGHDFAYAQYQSANDENSAYFIWRSVSIDLGFGLNWLNYPGLKNHAEYYNRFTTGNGL